MTAPTTAELEWMRSRSGHGDGSLAGFDKNGNPFSGEVMKVCIERGWVTESKETGNWFNVYRLTPEGRAVANRRKK